jgi:hypothetical protein
MVHDIWGLTWALDKGGLDALLPARLGLQSCIVRSAYSGRLGLTLFVPVPFICLSLLPVLRLFDWLIRVCDSVSSRGGSRSMLGLGRF